MNPFEMVVLIVAIVMIARVIISRNASRQDSGRRPETDHLRDEVARLKERVNTLERLAVDRGRRLADEIDALGRDG